MADRNMNERRYLHQDTVESMRLWCMPSDKFSMAGVEPGKIDPYATGTTQLFPLGSELWYGERKFRYALNGAVALGVGKLCQAVVPLAGHIDEVQGGAAVGDTTIAFTPNTLTTDDLAADELADGYIHINSGTGLGYMLRIKSHPAILGAVSGTLTLYDPVPLAIAAAAKATVWHNTWRKVIIHPSPATAKLVGVPIAAVAANAYCWLQVGGPCPVLVDGTVVIGSKVQDSTSVDGAVIPAASNGTDGDLQDVGVCMAVNATTEYSVIWLTIAN